MSRHVLQAEGQGDVQLDLDALPPEQQKELVAFVKNVLDARSETVLETCSHTALLQQRPGERLRIYTNIT